jgi:hypothetical protein
MKEPSAPMLWVIAVGSAIRMEIVVIFPSAPQLAKVQGLGRSFVGLNADSTVTSLNPVDPLCLVICPSCSTRQDRKMFKSRPISEMLIAKGRQKYASGEPTPSTNKIDLSSWMDGLGG